MNCCVVPRAMEGLTGLMAMETSAAELTVSVVEPVIEPEVALIVVVPAATLVASPVELMVATLVVEEAQVAELVRFCVEPSV